MRIAAVMVAFILLIGASMLSGCGGAKLGGAYKKIEPVPSDKALIYIYRIPAFVGGIYSVGIAVNEKEITALPEGGFYPYLADPGEVEISTKAAISRGESVTVEGKGGQTYYLEVSTTAGVFSGQATIEKVPKERGEERLLEMRRAPDKTP